MRRHLGGRWWINTRIRRGGIGNQEEEEVGGIEAMAEGKGGIRVITTITTGVTTTGTRTPSTATVVAAATTTTTTATTTTARGTTTTAEVATGRTRMKVAIATTRMKVGMITAVAGTEEGSRMGTTKKRPAVGITGISGECRGEGTIGTATGTMMVAGTANPITRTTNVLNKPGARKGSTKNGRNPVPRRRGQGAKEEDSNPNPKMRSKQTRIRNSSGNSAISRRNRMMGGPP